MMQFYTKIGKNPDLLEGIVSQDDVLRIAKTIGKEDDKDVLSRISFELSLGEPPEESLRTKLPLLTQTLDVLDEALHESTIEELQGKKTLFLIYKRLAGIQKHIQDESIRKVILDTGFASTDDLDGIKNVFDALWEIFYTPSAAHKMYFKEFGRLGQYRLFLKDCALLYCELSGKKFTVDFHNVVPPTEKESNVEPLTEGTSFVYEFHVLLNRIGAKYSCRPFTDSNFVTSCKAVRTMMTESPSPVMRGVD